MISSSFPSFDDCLPELDQFIYALMNEFQGGNLKSWDELDGLVKTFFTPEQMDLTCHVVPHWRKMASYMDGITLTHVMCVFTGLYMMPEFLAMTANQQQMMKWVILFHDVEKEPKPGTRDHVHAFRSTVGAAESLTGIGFPVTGEYKTIFEEWSKFTLSAKTTLGDPPIAMQDNQKLPKILEGIERMFGHNTPAALILKTILFHLSIDMVDWPPPNPLTQEEIIKYIDLELLPLLRVMNLGDSEGWALFHPETRARHRLDTLQAFETLERLLSR
jgi:hypothetical protein